MILPSIHVSMRIALRAGPLCARRLTERLHELGRTEQTYGDLLALAEQDKRYAVETASFAGHGPDCLWTTPICTAPGVLLAEDPSHWVHLLEAVQRWIHGDELLETPQPEASALIQMLREGGIGDDLLTAVEGTDSIPDRTVARLVNLGQGINPRLRQGSTSPLVLLLGASGAGKSTVLGALLGTQTYGFPAVSPGSPPTSPGRTTTTATTVSCEPASGMFEGTAHFHSADVIGSLLWENLNSAARAAARGDDIAVVSRKLLTHRSLDLRLAYLVDEHDAQAWAAHLQAGNEPGPLLPVAMGHLARRAAEFGGALVTFDEQGWPLSWRHQEQDQSRFMAALTAVTSNDRRRFGPLLSPLVQRIHVRGPFVPSWGELHQRLHLLDTAGLDPQTNPESSLTADHLRWMEEADVVVVVDNAANPQGRETRELLEALIRSGNVHKLALLHTQVDHAADGEIHDDVEVAVKRAAGQVASTLAAFEKRTDLPTPAVAQLRRQLDEQTFYCGGLTDPAAGHPWFDGSRGTPDNDVHTLSVADLQRLLQYLESATGGSRGRHLRLIRQLHAAGTRGQTRPARPSETGNKNLTDN